jgi:hypothetical protein
MIIFSTGAQMVCGETNGRKKEGEEGEAYIQPLGGVLIYLRLVDNLWSVLSI